MVNDDYFSGTLKHLATGPIATQWGAGNFMALKFTVPTGATSCRVGMSPSQGSGLIEIINDPDKNGVWKVTNKETQKFVIITSDATSSVTKEYSLASLTCEGATEEE